MKNDIDDGDDTELRDTRLDPMESEPDATLPGSEILPPADDTEAVATSSQDCPQTFPQSELQPVAAVASEPPPPKEFPPAPADVIVTPLATEAFTRPSAPPVDAFRARAPRRHPGWPFVPLAPLLVVLVGVAVALGIGLVGLDQLSRAGDEHAGARAELIAATVAARLGALPQELRLEATQLAARRSAAELLVVTAGGEVIHDQTLGAPDPVALKTMLATSKGVAEMRMGRARYAVRAIGPSTDPNAHRLVVLVPEPRAAMGVNPLASALAALAVLLLSVAAGVAYAVSHDVTRDVDFVTDRVRAMAHVRSEPTGELIPMRTMDEVGVLTATFNKLVARFALASTAYREDLSRASSADRERAAFLAAVSHELRSPLNAILGFADILVEEVDGPLSPSAREEVEQIRGSGAHLLALINDILEFSALESGQLRLSRGRVDVFALAHEVVREARGLVGDKPLTVAIEGESLVARVDARRVRQILGNLVNNAIKFTQRGHVVVCVRREGMMAALLVSDSGPGISPQERAVIFEEYKQARSERHRRRGTGLGLAITRRLVLLHNGSISVESELGHGSTFTVRLPIGDVDAPPSRRFPRPPTVPDPQTGGVK
ncbi:MAG TPA: HAMP domain-containing sensor histidine kinase [Labilithrix sp.]|nr:HAMP domain-containing sensor histidine kinase [Labilithrix sp.]